MKLYTIGFTKTSAENFFSRLSRAGVNRVLDTRLNRTSQLAGFAKQDDLKYFLKATSSISYGVAQMLAPTDDILKAYRAGKMDWSSYESAYLRLLEQRRVCEVLKPTDIDGSCFLCSESTPEHCHRRLAAEYLSRSWGDLRIIHL